MNDDSARLGEAIEKIKLFAKKTSVDNVVILISGEGEEGGKEKEEDGGKIDNDIDNSATYMTYGQNYLMVNSGKKSHITNRINHNLLVVKGSEFMQEKLLGKDFSYPIFGFFQNNSFAAEKMQGYVGKLLESYNTKEAKLLDLYAGVGTFGIINAELFSSTVMVESFPAGAAEARKNVVRNNVRNGLVYELDAKQLRKISLSGKLLVITDPPRSGMDIKVIQQLQELKPEVIIYVSCNPEQLGKDIVKFKDYKVKSAALFDMFPQTRHGEAVVELVRK